MFTKIFIDYKYVLKIEIDIKVESSRLDLVLPKPNVLYYYFDDINLIIIRFYTDILVL